MGLGTGSGSGTGVAVPLGEGLGDGTGVAVGVGVGETCKAVIRPLPSQRNAMTTPEPQRKVELPALLQKLDS